MLSSRAALAIPTAMAHTISLVVLKKAISSLKPFPSLPTRFETGTLTSEKATSAVSLALIPILPYNLFASYPGLSVSTITNECLLCLSVFSGSVLQNTTRNLAISPFVINILFPLMTYSSPSLMAVVIAPAASDPASGSVIAHPVKALPSVKSGRYFFFSSSVANILIISEPKVDVIIAFAIPASTAQNSSVIRQCSK